MPGYNIPIFAENINWILLKTGKYNAGQDLYYHLHTINSSSTHIAIAPPNTHRQVKNKPDLRCQNALTLTKL